MNHIKVIFQSQINGVELINMDTGEELDSWGPNKDPKAAEVSDLITNYGAAFYHVNEDGEDDDEDEGGFFGYITDIKEHARMAVTVTYGEHVKMTFEEDSLTT